MTNGWYLKCQALFSGKIKEKTYWNVCWHLNQIVIVKTKWGRKTTDRQGTKDVGKLSAEIIH